MDELRFQWDEKKNRANKRKHGVSFEEARSVFFDQDAVEYYDDKHTDQEDRFILIGASAKLRILLICHCLREEGSVIRIISAHKATKKQQLDYPWGVK